jgi:hypothetical protein
VVLIYYPACTLLLRPVATSRLVLTCPCCLPLGSFIAAPRATCHGTASDRYVRGAARRGQWERPGWLACHCMLICRLYSIHHHHAG